MCCSLRRLEKEVAELRLEVRREALRANQERAAALAAVVEESGKKLQVPLPPIPVTCRLCRFWTPCWGWSAVTSGMGTLALACCIPVSFPAIPTALLLLLCTGAGDISYRISVVAAMPAALWLFLVQRPARFPVKGTTSRTVIQGFCCGGFRADVTTQVLSITAAWA